MNGDGEEQICVLWTEKMPNAPTSKTQKLR